MSTEKHCPGCGAVVNPGQPFCPRCGHDLAGIWAASGVLPAGTGGITGTGPVSGGSAPIPSTPLGSAPITPGPQTPVGAPMVQQGGSARPWPFSAEILAERLVVGGYVQKPAIDALLAESQTSGVSIVRLVRQQQLLAPDQLRDAMSRIFGLPVANLQAIRIDPTLIASFPSEVAREHMLLPLHREGDRLVMVVADPTQAETIRLVRRTVGLTIDLRLASLDELAPVVHQYFSPRLVALLPSGETLDIVIPHGELKIGRSDHNDIVLPDPTVGSTHAVLRALDKSYQIVDFGSRNGVYVDGKKIQGTQPLKNGDVIQIGQCLLTFKLPIPEAAQSHDGATQLLSPQKIAAAAPIIQASGQMRTPFQSGAGVIAVAEDDDESGKKKKKKGKKEKDDRMRSAWIGFASRIIAQVLGAAATIILGLAVAGKLPTSCGVSGSEMASNKPPADAKLVTPELFAERNGKDVYNISGIVPLDGNRFLFCDNNIGDALFEFTVDAEGKKNSQIVRRPLVGVQPGQLDDIEDLTVADLGSTRYIVGTTSLLKRQSKKKAEFGDVPSGLIRVKVNDDGSLGTEVIPNFRDWFLSNVKGLPASAGLEEPDAYGLNVEGLAWDAANGRLLFGLRTPTGSGTNKVFVVPVKVKDQAGPWDATNLAAEPAIEVVIEDTGQDEGIRGISYDPSRKAFLMLVGNATSASNAPFLLYKWDGSASSATRFKNVWFGKDVKAEGLTHATIGDKGALVIADDAGGFSVMWDSDPRIQ